jgi:hypothetical protein
MNDDHLRYPIGKFNAADAYSLQDVAANIKRIEAVPSRIEALSKTLSQTQLETAYRPDGWTARQVIHHVADSHLNAYVRFKWTLTEQTPTIKAYDEKLWADTPEVKLDPMISINFLKALHAKWVLLLSALGPAELQREFVHPESKKNFRLDRTIALYAWHGEHHLGHLEIISRK